MKANIRKPLPLKAKIVLGVALVAVLTLAVFLFLKFTATENYIVMRDGEATSSAQADDSIVESQKIMDEQVDSFMAEFKKDKTAYLTKSVSYPAGACDDKDEENSCIVGPWVEYNFNLDSSNEGEAVRNITEHLVDAGFIVNKSPNVAPYSEKYVKAVNKKLDAALGENLAWTVDLTGEQETIKNEILDEQYSELMDDVIKNGSDSEYFAGAGYTFFCLPADTVLHDGSCSNPMMGSLTFETIGVDGKASLVLKIPLGDQTIYDPNVVPMVEGKNYFREDFDKLNTQNLGVCSTEPSLLYPQWLVWPDGETRCLDEGK